MKKGLNTTAKKKKNTSAGFHDMEGNHLSIHWNPTYKRFSIGITDPWGSGTNSIELGYEDLRSLFKESEEIFFQHEGLTDERSFPKCNAEGQIVTARGRDLGTQRLIQRQEQHCFRVDD